MIEFSAELEIGAAPDAVWRTMTDPSRESDWMRAVHNVAFVGEAEGYAIGAHMRRSGKFLWMTLSWESEVVAFEPGGLVAFRHVAGALKGESRWELTPTGSGCRVRLASAGPPPGPLTRFPGLAAAAGRAGLRGDLARLKRLVEE